VDLDSWDEKESVWLGSALIDGYTKNM